MARTTHDDVMTSCRTARGAWINATGDTRSWQINTGSKSQGVSWTGHFSGTGTAIPGAQFAGHIGTTAKEAAATLDTITRTLRDLAHHQRTHPTPEA